MRSGDVACGSRSADSIVRESLRIEADDEFRKFVQDPLFPCLGAKSAVRLDGYTLEVYGSLADENETTKVGSDLAAFSAGITTVDKRLRAFIAVFPGRVPSDEISFEQSLWRQLQLLHESDADRGEWAPDTSSDPSDPHFSFSFGGRAYFIVGLHPNSSRIARRFRWPALVFNPHSQFTRLREEGRFEGLRSATRARDTALQGTENPNLADFGEVSEARQYSGRKTERDWKCPFHHKPA